jgi:hypothetical protein
MTSPMKGPRPLNTRNWAAVVGATAVLGAFASPAQADASAVCNEAEASFRGGYTVTDSQDPNPPARLVGGPGHAMAVGNGQLNAGLLNAAEKSPALALCGEGNGGPTGGDGGGDGGSGGGDDGSGGPT